MRKIYDIVYKAQTTACAQIKAGITGKEGDAIARAIIAEAGYGDRFGHSLGHSLGLFIHESPNYSQRCEDIIEENMVLSIEPGIYLPGKFGVRIEDIAIVKKDGIVNLTHSPKELIII
jgi:Xaa-Pro aminopeptidase